MAEYVAGIKKLIIPAFVGCKYEFESRLTEERFKNMIIFGVLIGGNACDGYAKDSRLCRERYGVV